MALTADPLDISTAMMAEATAVADWLAVAPVVLPLLTGAALLMLRNRLQLQAWGANIVLALNVALCAALLERVWMDGPLTMTMGNWLPPFGISFSVDIAGATLALAAAVAALACGLFSLADIDLIRRRHGFYTFLLLMMAGVNGAFLTGDVFNLYVWFEVLLIASFGLIVIGSEPRQLDGALKYAFLNLIATTLFLIATGYLYGVLGTLNMADVARKAGEASSSAPLAAIATLYLLAFAMKAAAFPVNFWLPASYHTPRIAVSAVFAGILTKVGVYALLRVLTMVLAGQGELLTPLIGAVAVATMFIGVFGALAQSDLRRLLGYLIIGGIGTMLAGVAAGGETGISGAVAYAAHSMLVITGLYLAAGIIGRRAGGFDLHRLGGHYADSPYLSAAFLLLAFAVAGLPPLSGFWPKLLVVKGALSSGQGLIAFAVLASALLTSIAIMRVWLLAFWRDVPGGERAVAQTATSGPRSFLFAPVAVLVAISVLLGILPEPLLAASTAAARGIADPAAYIGSVFGGMQ